VSYTPAQKRALRRIQQGFSVTPEKLLELVKALVEDNKRLQEKLEKAALEIETLKTPATP
jgi:hypothetical protein